MFHIGSREFGKVDHLPGVFYVTTSFLHVNYIPLIPGESRLVVDGTDRSVLIGLSYKSLLVAWLRTILVIGGVFLSFVAMAQFDFWRKGRADWPEVVAAAAGTLVLFLLFWLSYRFSRPTPRRALQLVLAAGLDPQQVVEYYGKVDTAAPLGRAAPEPKETNRTDA